MHYHDGVVVVIIVTVTGAHLEPVLTAAKATWFRVNDPLRFIYTERKRIFSSIFVTAQCELIEEAIWKQRLFRFRSHRINEPLWCNV